jgi:pimeloyl-ACP methyl ester carboxylesterase
MAIQRARPISRANALRQLLSAARFHAPALAPEVPLLVLASRQDALVDPRCSRRVAELWRADFAEHPTAGHDLPLDDGPWVAQQISRWMSLMEGRVGSPSTGP